MLQTLDKLLQMMSCARRNYNDNSQRTTSYAADVPTRASLLGGSAGANNPNGVTLTGPGGNSVTLGRKLLQEAPVLAL